MAENGGLGRERGRLKKTYIYTQNAVLPLLPLLPPLQALWNKGFMVTTYPPFRLLLLLPKVVTAAF